MHRFLRPTHVLLAIALLAAACSPTQREWRRAKRANTSEGYRIFAQANPTDRHRAEALDRTEKLDWQAAVTRDSVDAWGTYVAYHPGSARIGEARARLEEARWKSAVEEQSRQGYELYLGAHPDGRHAEEARTHLDEVAWAEAQREGTEEAYARYLTRYSKGAHADEAVQRRQEIFWTRAVETDDPKAYRIYVRKFPDGPHATEAESAIDGFRFSGVAVRLVVKATVRGDSLQTYRRNVEPSLSAALKRNGFAFEWIDVVDARGRQVDPFEGLLEAVPEGHAAMVVVIEERRGRGFDPDGFATDIAGTVHIVPPARTQPFIEEPVEATTGKKVTVVGGDLSSLHLDAQRQLGEALAGLDLGLVEWRR